MDVRDVDVSQVTAGLVFNGISSSLMSSPSCLLACRCCPFIPSIIHFFALSNATFLLVCQIDLLGARGWIMFGSTGWD